MGAYNRKRYNQILLWNHNVISKKKKSEFLHYDKFKEGEVFVLEFKPKLVLASHSSHNILNFYKFLDKKFAFFGNKS